LPDSPKEVIIQCPVCNAKNAVLVAMVLRYQNFQWLWCQGKGCGNIVWFIPKKVLTDINKVWMGAVKNAKKKPNFGGILN
jgi:hypothetical protein